MKQILYQYYFQIKILGSSINISVSEIFMQITPSRSGGPHTKRLFLQIYILFRTRFQCLHSGYHLIARKQFMVIGITFVGFLSHRYQVYIYWFPQKKKKTITNEYFSGQKFFFQSYFVRRKLRRVNKTKHATS